MKSKIYILLLLCGVPARSFAQDQQLVAPGGLANVEGNSSISQPFNSSSFRFQQLFDASLFAGVGNATARIDSISFRIDGASMNNVILFFGGGTVVLSTTPRSTDGLSATFSENQGGDAVPIWSGAFSFAGDPVPAGPPYAFHETFLASTPFFYIPSQGNLLLDITAGNGKAFLPGALDAQSVNGDSVSTVYANSFNALTGTTDSSGLVTRFDYEVVPEPPSAALMLIGLGLLIQVVRRRRRYAPVPASAVCFLKGKRQL